MASPSRLFAATLCVAAMMLTVHGQGIPSVAECQSRVNSIGENAILQQLSSCTGTTPSAACCRAATGLLGFPGSGRLAGCLCNAPNLELTLSSVSNNALARSAGVTRQSVQSVMNQCRVPNANLAGSCPAAGGAAAAATTATPATTTATTTAAPATTTAVPVTTAPAAGAGATAAAGASAASKATADVAKGTVAVEEKKEEVEQVEDKDSSEDSKHHHESGRPFLAHRPILSALLARHDKHWESGRRLLSGHVAADAKAAVAVKVEEHHDKHDEDDSKHARLFPFLHAHHERAHEFAKAAVAAHVAVHDAIADAVVDKVAVVVDAHEDKREAVLAAVAGRRLLTADSAVEVKAPVAAVAVSKAGVDVKGPGADVSVKAPVAVVAGDAKASAVADARAAVVTKVEETKAVAVADAAVKVASKAAAVVGVKVDGKHHDDVDKDSKHARLHPAVLHAHHNGVHAHKLAKAAVAAHVAVHDAIADAIAGTVAAVVDAHEAKREAVLAKSG